MQWGVGERGSCRGLATCTLWKPQAPGATDDAEDVLVLRGEAGRGPAAGRVAEGWGEGWTHGWSLREGGSPARRGLSRREVRAGGWGCAQSEGDGKTARLLHGSSGSASTGLSSEWGAGGPGRGCGALCPSASATSGSPGLEGDDRQKKWTKLGAGLGQLAGAKRGQR